MSGGILRSGVTHASGWKMLLKALSFPAFALMIALLLLGVTIGIGLIGYLGIIGACSLILFIVFNRDEFVVVSVLFVQIYIDWYVSYRIVSILLVVALLFLYFLNRSVQKPWTEPRGLLLWGAFLLLAIFPAARGALTRHDLLIYYPDLVLGAFVMFWLGTVVSRSAFSLQRLFQMLGIFGTLLALHTIIEAVTGVFLLVLPRAADYVASLNYGLGASSDVRRAESFFIDPNWNGTFLAIMFFMPLALFIKSNSWLGRLVYLFEILIILLALLYTYSASASLAVFVGVSIFTLFIGSMRYRLQLCLYIGFVALTLIILFPSQLNLLLNHATDPSELALRSAVWRTAFNVIRNFPFTGVGLGHLAYLQAAEPFRVPEQFVPLDHPHNSYLEWGVMAGLPILCLFLCLILFSWRQALRTWIHADGEVRILIAGGIAATAALSFNSWSNQGWTLPPLAGIGWLLLGCISSPLLKRYSSDKAIQEKSSLEQNKHTSIKR